MRLSYIRWLIQAKIIKCSDFDDFEWLHFFGGCFFNRRHYDFFFEFSHVDSILFNDSLLGVGNDRNIIVMLCVQRDISFSETRTLRQVHSVLVKLGLFVRNLFLVVVGGFLGVTARARVPSNDYSLAEDRVVPGHFFLGSEKVLQSRALVVSVWVTKFTLGVTVSISGFAIGFLVAAIALSTVTTVALCTSVVSSLSTIALCTSVVSSLSTIAIVAIAVSTISTVAVSTISTVAPRTSVVSTLSTITVVATSSVSAIALSVRATTIAAVTVSVAVSVAMSIAVAISSIVVCAVSISTVSISSIVVCAVAIGIGTAIVALSTVAIACTVALSTVAIACTVALLMIKLTLF